MRGLEGRPFVADFAATEGRLRRLKALRSTERLKASLQRGQADYTCGRRASIVIVVVVMMFAVLLVLVAIVILLRLDAQQLAGAVEGQLKF